MKFLRTKFIIWLTVTGVGVALAVVVIVFTNRRIARTATQVQNLLTQAATSDAAIRSLIEAQRQATQLATDLTSLQTAFIQNDNPLTYLTELEAIASANDVTVNFSIGENSATTLLNGARVVSTTITVTGLWENEAAFINALMQHPIYFTVDHIEIDGTNPNSDDSVTITLDGNTYWQ